MDNLLGHDVNVDICEGVSRSSYLCCLNRLLNNCLTPDMFKKRYQEIYEGDENWKSIESAKKMTYNWRDSSTYIKHPPFFTNEITTGMKNISPTKFDIIS